MAPKRIVVVGLFTFSFIDFESLALGWELLGGVQGTEPPRSPAVIAANLSIRGGVNDGFVIESKHVRETISWRRISISNILPNCLLC